jgi:hypothetical protein
VSCLSNFTIFDDCKTCFNTAPKVLLWQYRCDLYDISQTSSSLVSKIATQKRSSQYNILTMMKRVFTGLATLTPLARGHSAPYPFAASSVLASLRGGSESSPSATVTGSVTARSFSSNNSGAGASSPEYTSLAEPAPGSPFHWAFPVHNLQAAKEFYGNVLGCKEGRSSVKWQDYS